MKLSTRMVVVLTAIGLLSGTFLATVGQMTRERIILNKKREIEAAVLRVVPGATASQVLFEDKNFAVFQANSAEGSVAGYAIQTAGSGFQDKIVLIVGTNPEITRITSLTVIDQKETPGLGAKITDEKAFLRYWVNRDCSQPLRLRKPPVEDPAGLGPSEVNAITGATVSSEAVVATVNAALQRARQLKAEGKIGNGK